MRNAFGFVAAAVPIRLAGALALGLLLASRFRGVAAARTAVYLPTAVPDVAYAILWLWLLNPLYGPLNLVLGSLGAPTPAWLTDPTSARWAVILMTVCTLGKASCSCSPCAPACRASCTSSPRSRARGRGGC
jgi:multiple sugar transport system permease protein